MESKHQTLSDILATKEQTVSALSESAIQSTPSAGLELAQILPANLSWSHYERLMRIADEDERDWYLPTNEQLAAEIIKQKEIFELQTGKKAQE